MLVNNDQTLGIDINQRTVWIPAICLFSGPAASVFPVFSALHGHHFFRQRSKGPIAKTSVYALETQTHQDPDQHVRTGPYLETCCTIWGCVIHTCCPFRLHEHFSHISLAYWSITWAYEYYIPPFATPTSALHVRIATTAVHVYEKYGHGQLQAPFKAYTYLNNFLSPT